MPKSAGARALLVRAYASNGQFEAARRSSAELHDLTPETAEDFLFMGIDANSRQDFEAALKYADEAVRRRPSLVAYSFRGDARFNWADDTGDLATAEAAVEDEDAVKRFLPDEPFEILESVEARLIAASTMQPPDCRTNGKRFSPRRPAKWKSSNVTTTTRPP